MSLTANDSILWSIEVLSSIMDFGVKRSANTKAEAENKARTAYITVILITKTRNVDKRRPIRFPMEESIESIEKLVAHFLLSADSMMSKFMGVL